MSHNEICVHHLVGKRVVDIDGANVGRLKDMRAEIVLRPEGNDYVVVEYLVDSHVIPWSWMDLTDPTRPRITRRRGELPTQSAIATST